MKKLIVIVIGVFLAFPMNILSESKRSVLFSEGVEKCVSEVLVAHMLDINESTISPTSVSGKIVGGPNRTEKALNKIFQTIDQTTDCAIVRLLAYYIGESTHEDLVNEIVARRPQIDPTLIEFKQWIIQVEKWKQADCGLIVILSKSDILGNIQEILETEDE
jgi:hypothetical protein